MDTKNNSEQTDVKIQEQQTGPSLDMGKLQELLRLVNGMQGSNNDVQSSSVNQRTADPRTANGGLTSQETAMIMNILEKKLSPEDRSRLEMFRTISRLFTMNQR